MFTDVYFHKYLHAAKSINCGGPICWLLSNNDQKHWFTKKQENISNGENFNTVWGHQYHNP